MALSSVIGQTYAKSRLGTLFSGDPGHAYVFTGPVGIGKKKLAREVAQALLCGSATSDGGCGECPDCIYFREGTHPDYRELFAASGDKNIRVADVRSRICGDVSIYPQISRRKIYLIDGDGLNEEGQNALLKTLEEPPPYAVFLLVVTDAAKLLATIVSRSTVIALSPNRTEEIIEILRRSSDVSEEDAKFFARYANGIPGQALFLAASPWFSELREETLEILLAIPGNSRTWLLTEGYTFFDAGKDHIDEIFMIFALALRDMAFLCREPESDALLNTDKKDKISHIIRRHRPDILSIHRASCAVTTASKCLRANCTFESTICRMLLSIHKELTNA